MDGALIHPPATVIDDDDSSRALWSLWVLLQRLRDMLDSDESLDARWQDTAPHTRPKDDGGRDE